MYLIYYLCCTRWVVGQVCCAQPWPCSCLPPTGLPQISILLPAGTKYTSPTDQPGLAFWKIWIAQRHTMWFLLLLFSLPLTPSSLSLMLQRIPASLCAFDFTSRRFLAIAQAPKGAGRVKAHRCNSQEGDGRIRYPAGLVCLYWPMVWPCLASPCCCTLRRDPSCSGPGTHWSEDSGRRQQNSSSWNVPSQDQTSLKMEVEASPSCKTNTDNQLFQYCPTRKDNAGSITFKNWECLYFD